jgi:hypothetical protein
MPWKHKDYPDVTVSPTTWPKNHHVYCENCGKSFGGHYTNHEYNLITCKSNEEIESKPTHNPLDWPE